MARPPRPEPRRPLDLREIRNAAALVAAGPSAFVLPRAHSVLSKYAPDIPEPPLLVELAPVAGPTWQAVEDLQDGDYAGAVLNGTLAELDAFTGGLAEKTYKTVKAVNTMLAGKPLTARRVQEYTKKLLDKEGRDWEAHHTIPLNGTARNIVDWRNHPALIKVIPTPTHKRLHGSYKGKPPFGPLSKAWYGTTDWMKAGAATVAGHSAAAAGNLLRDRSPPPKRKP